MNKTALSIIIVGLVIGIGIVFMGGSKEKNTNANISSSSPTQNIEIKDGIQYVTIDAKGGYLPRVSTAKAGIPTKLIVKTNGTYDCSSSLSIRAIDYQKILPQTGEEVIDIGIQKVGPFQGTCSMGMYSFTINFE